MATDGYLIQIQAVRIAKYIREFDFSNYGMDDVDDLKDEEWLEGLALHIALKLSR